MRKEIGEPKTRTKSASPEMELAILPQTNGDPNVNMSNPDVEASKIRLFVAFIVLILSNVINCMEIYSLVGVISQIRVYFDLNYAKVSLNQCMLTVGITMAYPFLSMLENGNKRKVIVVVGTMIRSVSSFSSSFFGPNDYIGFLWLRFVTGFGTATILILGPKLIESSLSGLTKSITLSLFYLTIPIGSGLGMMVGPLSTLVANDWKWGLRILPVAGAIFSLALAFLMVEPPTSFDSADLRVAMETSPKNIRHLIFHKTYMLTTLAFMCVLFVTGALNVWGIFFMHRFGILRNSTLSFQLVGIIFGSSTASSGMVGMTLALTIAAQLRRFSTRAEIFMSGLAMMIGGPIFLMFTLEDSNYRKWGLLFMCMVSLYMTRPLLSDIMMNIIFPSHMKLAWSFQQIISHLLGDAIGAVLVGMSMDEMMANMRGKLEEIEYITLQASLYTVSFGFIISAAFYFIGAVFYRSFRKKNSL